jgi:pimeloyl-ACP methyl ester carboxylesterase
MSTTASPNETSAGSERLTWVGGERTEHVARPDGTRLCVTESGDGPTVVLTHGFGMSHTVWGLIAPALVRAGYRVVAFDHRGHGGSTVGRDGVTADALFGDLRAVLDERAPDRPLMVCHSMGNFVALGALAEDHAWSRVAGLVLVNPVTGESTREAPTARLQGPLVRRGIGQRLARNRRIGEALARMSLGGDASEAVVAATRAALAGVPVTATPMITEMQRKSIVAGLHSIRVPATVLAGTNDKTTPERHVRLLAANMPDVHVRFVPGAGHMGPWEFPDAILAAVRSTATRCG